MCELAWQEPFSFGILHGPCFLHAFACPPLCTHTPFCVRGNHPYCDNRTLATCIWHSHSIFISWEEHPGLLSGCDASVPPLSETRRTVPFLSGRCTQGKCLHFAKLSVIATWPTNPSVAVSVEPPKILKTRRRVKGVKALKSQFFRNILLCSAPNERNHADLAFLAVSYSEHSSSTVLT